MTEIATLNDQSGAMELLVDLERSGGADDVSLTLPALPYDEWEALGRLLGAVDKRVNWYIGDWINHGEALYGEQASQGVEATTSERYSIAESITGKEHGTLMNVASICGRIARERRRKELPFWVHAEVAALEPDEQVRWLEAAIEAGLSRGALRDAIRAEKNPPPPEVVADPGEHEPAGPSIGERIETAARLVYNQGHPTEDGGALVPAEAWAQLRAALGEE
jgi:hypothetical protein